MKQEKTLGQRIGESIFESLSEEEKRRCFTKTIPFTNDDVPKYLENLRKFENFLKKLERILWLELVTQHRIKQKDFSD